MTQNDENGNIEESRDLRLLTTTFWYYWLRSSTVIDRSLETYEGPATLHRRRPLGLVVWRWNDCTLSAVPHTSYASVYPSNQTEITLYCHADIVLSSPIIQIYHNNKKGCVQVKFSPVKRSGSAENNSDLRSSRFVDPSHPTYVITSLY